MKKLNLLVLIFLTSGIFPQILNAAQYNRHVNQTPFVKNYEYNSTSVNVKPKSLPNKYSTKTTNKQQSQTQQLTQQTQSQSQTRTQPQTQSQPQTQKLVNNQTVRNQQNNSVTKIQLPPRPNSQPKLQNSSKTNLTDFREVQFSGELFDMKILESDDNNFDNNFTNNNNNDNNSIISPKRIPEPAITQTPIENDEIKTPTKLITPITPITPIMPNHVPSAGFLKYSEEYPDPQNVGRVTPYARGGIGATHYDSDRVGAIPEEEVHHRHHIDATRKQLGQPPLTAAECPLCKDDPKTPCGTCKQCKKGYPCEKTVCRHCVQPLSRDMNNFCDLTAGGEPCGTCDSCREHRSDPCEHADDGRGPHGEWNPYKQSRIFAVIPRPILDEWNNGARKFPVYYNPAPYYRHYWNPSLYTGYARPYTFRYTCPVCDGETCKCNRPPFAGQVPFAYTCKFCNRNPCACAEDICDANAEMNPSGRKTSIESSRSESTRIQDAELRNQNENDSQDTKTNPNSNSTNNANTTTTPNPNGDSNSNQASPNPNDKQSLSDLLDETPTTPNRTTPTTPLPPAGKRPLLDVPKTQTPNVSPRSKVIN
ncbi:MAG: hypothetical protein LBB88_03180 [Planctomycetaceae bacterium]|jgi:hypothetical protein|nr:hypothetical protein [Planctomycetaceae bacterium]